MKNNKKKLLIITALIGFLPFKYAQGNIISFDIEVSSNYERVIEHKRDGSYSDNIDWKSINSETFSTQIDFDLFSENNKRETQNEHHFKSNGNDLAWWMAIFDYSSQEIYTPFANELLGLVNPNDYGNLSDKYTIFASGTYHYYNPDSDSDVRERITFRRELFGSTIIPVNDGRIQNDFSYWQQFTIHLPSPLSFASKSYFDSYSTDEMLANLSGSPVQFETYLAKRNWWNNDDHSERSYKFVENGYRGYGTYNYQSAQPVPEPSSPLFLSFALMCYLLSKRKLVK